MQGLGMFGVIDGYRIGGEGGLYANSDRPYVVYHKRFDRDIRKRKIYILPDKEGGWITAEREKTLFVQYALVNDYDEVLYDPNGEYFALSAVKDVREGIYLKHKQALVVSVREKDQYIPAYVVVGRDKNINSKDQITRMQIVKVRH